MSDFQQPTNSRDLQPNAAASEGVSEEQKRIVAAHVRLLRKLAETAADLAVRHLKTTDAVGTPKRVS